MRRTGLGKRQVEQVGPGVTSGVGGARGGVWASHLDNVDSNPATTTSLLYVEASHAARTVPGIYVDADRRLPNAANDAPMRLSVAENGHRLGEAQALFIAARSYPYAVSILRRPQSLPNGAERAL